MEKVHTLRLLARLGTLALAGFAGAAFADLQSAARESERYAGCLNASDIDCLLELTHPLARIQQLMIGSLSPLTTQSALLEFSREQAGDSYFGWRVEVGEPAPVAVGQTPAPDYDAQQFVVVPYLLRSSSWSERERSGYLLGVSADGERWCFADDTAVKVRGIERFLPDYAGRLPETAVKSIEPPGRVRSEYLDTTVGQFRTFRTIGEAHYELTFEVRKRVRDDIALVVAFENPADTEQPFIVPSVLAAKQDELRIVSPLVSGLRDGATYTAVVFGIGADGEELLFEHRQPMIYDSQRSIEPVTEVAGRLVNATRTEPRTVTMPGSIFPRDWYSARVYPSNDGQGVSGVLMPRVVVDESCHSRDSETAGGTSR